MAIQRRTRAGGKMDVCAQTGQGEARTRPPNFTNFVTFVTFYDKIHVLQTLFKDFRRENTPRTTIKPLFTEFD